MPYQGHKSVSVYTATHDELVDFAKKTHHTIPEVIDLAWEHFKKQKAKP